MSASQGLIHMSVGQWEYMSASQGIMHISGHARSTQRWSIMKTFTLTTLN